jgi:hypothetical protein
MVAQPRHDETETDEQVESYVSDAHGDMDEGEARKQAPRGGEGKVMPSTTA